jgi:hypothetical protein
MTDPTDLLTLAACDMCREQVPADELTDGRECGQAHCQPCAYREGCLPCQRDMQADVR